MKAVLCKSLGGPDALEMGELPEAAPGEGEAAIRVTAVSLNFFDTLMVRGKYQNRPELPFSPGGEVAGTVARIGSGVEGLTAGQRVLAYTGYNGCREQVIASARFVIPLPEGISDEAAAAIPIAYGTALHGLEDRGRVQAGQTVLILGATGGAGLAAIEVAVRLGADVVAAGTSDEKLKLCAERGAKQLLNLTGADVKEAVRALNGGNGPDVIYDFIGGPYTEPALRSIAWGGRYLVAGFAAGDIPKIPLNLLLLKGCELVGVNWGRHVKQNPPAFRDQIARLLGWCAKGEIRPHIDHVFPLEKTAEALRMIGNRQIKGKVIIRP
ncbi:MAG: NADPH:quinone oxidoreductase family protein [Rhodomicrobium sp.]|nr:NADPH:quinone oxidoreductase family protein [Rhodomicrobium sp.]